MRNARVACITAFLMLFLVKVPGMEAQEEYLFTRITTKQGLSHNQITSIFRDSKGFMWFGSNYGLNRFDGYAFRIFRHKPSDPNSLPDNRVNKIFEGPGGRLWVTLVGGSFIIYDPVTERFTRDSPLFHKNIEVPAEEVTRINQDMDGNIWFFTNTSGIYSYQHTSESIIHIEKERLPFDSVCAVQTDSKGNIWMIGYNGILEKADPSGSKTVFRTDILNSIFPQFSDLRFFIDREDRIWIYGVERDEGVLVYYPEKDRYRHFHSDSQDIRLSKDRVTSIVQDEKARIWIGTDHGGINIIDMQDNSVQVLLYNEDDDRSINQNSITAMYRDGEGIIWVGTFKKGICFYHDNLFKFKLFRHRQNDPHSIPFDDVHCFQEDLQGNLWIGTNGGGLIYYDRKENTYRSFNTDPEDMYTLSNDVIVSMLRDSKNQLWIGTYSGGLNRFDGTRFYRYRHNPSDPGSLSDNDVWEIYEDVFGNIWIGTLGSGLDMLAPGSDSFTHFRAGDSNSVHSDYILHIAGDDDGNLWIGTADGLDYYDHKKNIFRRYVHEPRNANSLSNDVATSVLLDSRGLIWIATQEGLNILKEPEEESTFYRYYVEDGLPDNTIQSVIEDNNGDIWVSTTNGITRVRLKDPADKGKFRLEFVNFSEADGLQGKEFNEGVAYKTREGELIFGGPDGFNLFNPSEMEINRVPPRVVITDLQILNRSVHIGKEIGGRVVLHKSVSETKEIVLKHTEDILDIEFTALNYLHPEKNRFEYKLVGFDQDWIPTSADDRRARYTNLDPGEYEFRVRASNNDGVWNEEGIRLRIVVEPPFWKTKAALIIYVLFLIAALFLLRFVILKRERKKYRIEQAQLEAQRRHELDLLKIRFFTNVSHEFRTPLSLIISPLESMLKKPEPEGEQTNHLKLVYRNARRLLNLVNQLLDFRRMEVQKIDLKPSYGDIINFIDEIYNSFTDLAEKKSIDFSMTSSHESFFTYFDHDKLEKIIFNLLSNAFKFTPEGKAISLDIALLDKENQVLSEGTRSDEEHKIKIIVSDTGLGIPAENLDKIFDRFFQANDTGNVVSQGSGIGLSLTKEFVELHQGSIDVESEPHKGTRFTVYLHLFTESSESASDDKRSEQTSAQENSSDHHDSEELIPDKQNASILLVEDNDDFRFYLKDNLKATYEIYEASNGREGLEKTKLHLPDLVVSDVMMPEMDGFELCKTLKSDTTTSHIPVILLTARMAQQKKLEGFETGADDYITKPFSFEMLESRIGNLISQRQRIKDSFQRHFKIEPGEITITSLDEKLMSKALKLVEDNMANPEFTVEKLSRELGMSRVHLYKKLTALTGKTPIEFIRIMRLKRAAQLLEKSQMTVAEVAYEVGFNDPRYFSKYFKTEFGMLPSQYIHSLKNRI